MQETQTSDKSIEEDINFDSFREAESEYEVEVQHGRVGTAQLKDCELVDYTEIPDYCRERTYKISKKYLLFEAELSNTDKTVNVICPAKDDGLSLRTTLEWGGAAEVSELAGKRVPIRHIKEDYYEVEVFDQNGSGPNLPYLPTNIIKSMADSNLLEFKSGRWKMPDTVKFSVTAIFASLLMLPIILASIMPTSFLSLMMFMIYPAALLLYFKISRQ